MRLSTPPESTMYDIPDGVAGTRATLKLMAGLVREYRGDPVIRDMCASLVSDLESGNFRAEIVRVFEYVRDVVRYMQDSNMVEVVQTPLYTMSHQYGDCDDKSTLLATMLESIGHPCRFVAVGYSRPGEFEHVFVETRVGSRWMGLDATMDVEPGFVPLYPYVEKPTMALMREWI